MGSWAVQDAKARFSELLDLVESSGPQIITKRGVQKAVVVPFAQWEQALARPKRTLLEILQSGPHGDLPIPPRNTWKMRKRLKF